MYLNLNLKTNHGKAFRRLLTCVLLIVLQHSALFSQTTPSNSEEKTGPNRKQWVTIGGTSLGITSLILLNELWYSDFPRTSFHTFNDGQEWLQMDKAGHAMTSYELGRVGHQSLKWAGVEERKALMWGGATGLLYLTGIEILDGFSVEWGFSASDELANLLGTSLYIGQELVWQEQRMSLKFSYHQTDFPAYRPDVLGSTWSESLLKDYNGQSYWLSINPRSFMKSPRKFPKWLNVAVGYGADGLISGNQSTSNPEFARRRQYYLSLDIDLRKIECKNAFLQTVFNTLGFIKIPAPTLEFYNNRLKFHPIYF